MIELASIAERDAKYIEGRDISNPGIFAEYFQITEDEKDTDAPRDRSERQIVAGKPQRDEAKHQRNRGRKQQAYRQRKPRRQAVGGREHRSRVGTDADK